MNQQSLNLPYIVLSGVVIIAIITSFMIIWPMVANINKTQDAIAMAKANLKDNQQILKTIDKKSAELKMQQVHEKELKVILPKEDSIDDVLRILDRSAATASVLIVSVDNNSSSIQATARTAIARGGKTEMPKNILPLGATVKVQGEYQKIRVFIDQLQKAPRLMNVSTIRLNPIKDEPGQVNADLNIVFYKYSSLK